MAKKFNTEDYTLFNSHVIALAGDGCLMEGNSSEASSLAGHLCLDNLIVIYDSNDICLDGPISECFTENVALRYESYGWQVMTIDGHDFNEITQAITKAKESNRPVLIEAKTTIGFGSPNRAGTAESHGKALGKEEGQLTKEALEIPTEPLFYIPESVTTFFSTLQEQQKHQEEEWNQLFDAWKSSNPNLYKHFELMQQNEVSDTLLDSIRALDIKPGIASRASSKSIIQTVSDQFASFIGGSADLSCSDSTYISNEELLSRDNFSGRNIKYGVREFAMGAVATGLSLSGFFDLYVEPFLHFQIT